MTIDAPKSNRWLDGYQYEQWPIRRHVGWTVVTAGWIDMDLERKTTSFNDRCRNKLPPGLPMLLKHIDRSGFAYCYRSDDGVIRLPVQLLEPWSR